MPSQVITLIAVSAVMFLVIGGLAFISHYYTLDGIKSKTVGDAQGQLYCSQDRCSSHEGQTAIVSRLGHPVWRAL